MARSISKKLNRKVVLAVLRTALAKRDIEGVVRLGIPYMEIAETLAVLRAANLLEESPNGKLSLTDKGLDVLRRESADPTFPWMDSLDEFRVDPAAKATIPRIGRDLKSQIEAHVRGRQGNLPGIASRDPAAD